MKKHLKRKYLVIACILPFLGLLLLEIVLRTFFPQPVSGFSKPLFQMQNGVPLLCPGVVAKQETQEFTIEIKGNSHGYRSGTWPYKPGKAPVVWLLGDSYGFGWGVTARQTVSAHLNRTEQWRIYNLAMPGDGFPRYLKRYQQMQKILPPPKLVVILTFDNDFSMPLLHRRRKKTGRNKYQEKIRWRTFLLKFHTVRLARRIVNVTRLNLLIAQWIGSRDLRLHVSQEVIEIHKKQYFTGKSWQQSHSQLQTLLKTIQQQNTRVLLVRIVPPFILNKTEEKSLLRELKVSKEIYDFQYLDRQLKKLNENYCKFSPPKKEGFYYRYDLHLTSKGHKHLAKFLYDKMFLILKK